MTPRSQILWALLKVKARGPAMSYKALCISAPPRLAPAVPQTHPARSHSRTLHLLVPLPGTLPRVPGSPPLLQWHFIRQLPVVPTTFIYTQRVSGRSTRDC